MLNDSEKMIAKTIQSKFHSDAIFMMRSFEYDCDLMKINASFFSIFTRYISLLNPRNDEITDVSITSSLRRLSSEWSCFFQELVNWKMKLFFILRFAWFESNSCSFSKISKYQPLSWRKLYIMGIPRLGMRLRYFYRQDKIS